MSSPEYLTPAQIAKFLGVNAKTVMRWCDRDQIKHWVTPGGHRRIPVDEVGRLLSNKKRMEEPWTSGDLSQSSQ